MWNRLLIGAGALVAGTLVATPAVLGLSGNSSFSRDIQVPVPSGAHQVHFVENEPSDDRTVAPRPAPTALGEHRRSRGRDDGARHDIGDDRGDDHGHAGRRGGDDHSGGDDRSGPEHRGHG